MTPEQPRRPTQAEAPTQDPGASTDPWEGVTLPRVDRAETSEPLPTGLREVCVVREVIIQYRGRALQAPASLRTPRDAADLARRIVKDHAREHFVVLYLDSRHQLVAHSVVSVGSANASLVHPREVYQSGVLLGAIAVILLHNHPSGVLTPSCEDRDLTKRLVDAGRTLGISVLDHVVFNHQNGFYSLRENCATVFEP
jgi:DNA repair protein RadC